MSISVFILSTRMKLPFGQTQRRIAPVATKAVNFQIAPNRLLFVAPRVELKDDTTKRTAYPIITIRRYLPAGSQS